MMTVRDLQKERMLADQQAQRLADLADKYAREKDQGRIRQPLEVGIPRQHEP